MKEKNLQRSSTGICIGINKNLIPICTDEDAWLLQKQPCCGPMGILLLRHNMKVALLSLLKQLIGFQSVKISCQCSLMGTFFNGDTVSKWPQTFLLTFLVPYQMTYALIQSVIKRANNIGQTVYTKETERYMVLLIMWCESFLFILIGWLCRGFKKTASHSDQGLQSQPRHQLRGVHSQSWWPVRWP